ncbi:MAG: hypothetical protein CSA26_03045 [Desulfobacterales bacterium]|nr:MAG: hypothetical protein CSA26_03045 [Desulfobacterales bacterium]
MFTIADIRNIAIQIEKNGEATYRKAAANASDPELAQILIWMADQEKKHAEWFSNLRSTMPLTREQKELEEMGKVLLQDMVKGNNFLLGEENLNSAQTTQKLFEISSSFEADTALFYEFLLGLIEEPEVQGQLQRIIEEERKHIKKLQELQELQEKQIA